MRYIDLSHCRDLIDTMKPEDVASLVKQKGKGSQPYISSEQLLTVYRYLEEKGLQSDAQKEMYLVENYFAIIDKDSNADLALRDVLLKTSPENQVIIYGDGSKEDFAQKKEMEKTILAKQLSNEAEKIQP